MGEGMFFCVKSRLRLSDWRPYAVRTTPCSRDATEGDAKWASAEEEKEELLGSSVKGLLGCFPSRGRQHLDTDCFSSFSVDGCIILLQFFLQQP